ncbi:MAG: glycosyltransferase family 4 protein [Planctomycetes bacterium]|nr:glycosyltransferase family 4 protein [Planctomycetota bacterium]
MERSQHPAIRRVAVIGNYLPRKCGIATFTADVCESLSAEYEDLVCFALPVNDTETGYAYPTRVRFELTEQDVASYRRAADYLNLNNVDLVCLQHEFGIFGGDAGGHILALLRELRMPLVATLHTILKEPGDAQRAVMDELGRLCDRLIVMSQRGVDFLKDIYGIPPGKIDLIPHGIPDVPFVDPNFYKDQFGVEGRNVILTFGLLSPNKGIENAIKALPSVCARHPNTTYLIVGATHPHLIRHEGEAYRESLEALTRKLGVHENVVFHNRFVSIEELVELIGAADIYVTPYLNQTQIVSGTLAYAVGAGKPVISTPYWHAEELLADGRGRLVPFNDPEAISEQILDLLDNEAERHAIRKRAYVFGREMIWSTVARRYMRSFERARDERARRPRAVDLRQVAEGRPPTLPPLKLDHLKRLTDTTGILQHAVFAVPNYDEGYATDDNARALVLAVLLEESDDKATVAAARALATTYLAFLWHAFEPQTGRFRNFMGYDRCWLEDVGSEDSHGRALWALGAAAGRSHDPRLRGAAARLFSQALPAALELSSPRQWAFSLLAIHEYLRQFYGDRPAQTAREVLAERLLELYRRTSSPEWPWFEDVVTYSNAKLPHALLLCGRWLARGDMTEAGLASLRWLADIQRSAEGYYMPIGNRGFYRRGGERARFDQQPVEAHTMVSACLEAYQVTGDEYWRTEARRAFDWFLGRNDLHLPLYDPTTGGCRDGLHPDRANQNEGAESTLAFLIGLVEMRMGESVINREAEMTEVVST